MIDVYMQLINGRVIKIDFDKYDFSIGTKDLVATSLMPPKIKPKPTPKRKKNGKAIENDTRLRFF